MNSELNQKISQLIDDELHFSEQEQVLQQLGDRPELIEKSNRFQAVSHILKTDDFILPKEDFLSKIKQQINQEPHYFLPKQKAKKRASGIWSKTGLAIAASVAAVAVLLFSKMNLQNNEVFPQKNLVVAEQQQVKDKETIQANNELADRQHQRLKAYIQAHSNDLYTHGSVNIHPYASVANYGQE